MQMKQIELSLGAPPWEPTASLRMVRQLSFYDVPLSGVLREKGWFAGQHYLFWCLLGHGDDFSVWAYAPITRADARKLREATGDRLRRLQAELLLRGDFTVALAHHEYGIREKTTLSTGEAQTEADLVPQAGAKLRSQLNEETQGLQGLVFA